MKVEDLDDFLEVSFLLHNKTIKCKIRGQLSFDFIKFVIYKIQNLFNNLPNICIFVYRLQA